MIISSFTVGGYLGPAPVFVLVSFWAGRVRYSTYTTYLSGLQASNPLYSYGRTVGVPGENRRLARLRKDNPLGFEQSSQPDVTMC